MTVAPYLLLRGFPVKPGHWFPRANGLSDGQRILLDTRQTKVDYYINRYLWIDVIMTKRNSRYQTRPAKEQNKLLEFDGNLTLAAFVGKSLSDENRLRILLSLCNGKKTVSTIVEEMNLSQPLVSHHLKELRRCLLVNVERKGLFVYYEIADKRIIDIVRQLAQLGKGFTVEKGDVLACGDEPWARAEYRSSLSRWIRLRRQAKWLMRQKNSFLIWVRKPFGISLPI